MVLPSCFRMDPGKSQLLNSLKAYLNNKTRLQPIIGLGTIIECVNVSSRTRETFYLCELCVCRLTKADMQNHIMGSHHRFNYIKAYHANLVSKWPGSPDLSKLAWPLMELAKVLEKNEGPGCVKLFEVQDNLYQIIATQSENHAVTLMKTLKQEQAQMESLSQSQSLHYPVMSQRTVLPARNQWEGPEAFGRTDIKPFQSSQQTAFNSPLKNTSAPELEKVQMSAEPSAVLENSNGILDDLLGAKPLIGLVRVVEFRSEDGCSYCFLCHCCRIRSTKQDMIEHLTSSSHIINYLMEIYPEQIEALGEGTEDDSQLQSMAAKVEEEEGRGEMKIINVPESICSQLTGKSYHWCLKMLSSGEEPSNLQQKREAVIGINKNIARHVPKESPVVNTKQAIRVKSMKKKKRKKTNTMFNVSLPIGEGELLLERRSFRMDRLFESSESPSSKPDPFTSPPDLDETRSVTDNTADPIDTHLEVQTPQLEEHLYLEDADTGDYMSKKHITVTVFQDGHGYVGDNVSGLNYVSRSQDSSSGDLRYGDLQTQWGGSFPARPHSKKFSPYNSYYKEASCGSDLWHSSASAGTKGQASSVELNSTYFPWHQNQPLSWSDSHPDMHRMWENQVVPYLKAARINVTSHSEHIPVYMGSISSTPGGPVQETEQRRAQTYTGFPTDRHLTAPQFYTAPSTAYEVSPVQQRLMLYAYPNASPCANPNFMYPVTDYGGSGWTQADAFNSAWAS